MENALYLHVYPWVTEYISLTSCKKGQPVASEDSLEVSQSRILIKMAVTWQYVRDTELNMACLGYQVENVRTLFMEITVKGKPERGASGIGDEQRNHVKVEHIRFSRSG